MKKLDMDEEALQLAYSVFNERIASLGENHRETEIAAMTIYGFREEAGDN